MTFNLKFLFLGFITSLISLCLTVNLVPIINNYARRKKILDIPNNRKQKKTNLPRIGGLSIITGYIFSILIVLFINNLFGIISIDYKYIKIFTLSSILFFGIGFTDDLKSLSPTKRLFTQFILAFLVWKNNIKFTSIFIPIFGESIISLSDISSLLITTFWIVGIINSINWLDGIDGLAVGIAIICNLTFLIFSLSQENLTLFILICSTLGASLGFLRFNIYPSKILMGDGGSYFQGINLALFSIILFTIPSQEIIDSKVVSLDIVTPLLILALPILDSIRVFFNRLINCHSPFYPDRTHIHHLLLNKGLTEDNVVNILYLVNIGLCIMALIFNEFGLKYLVIFFMTLLIFRRILIFKRN